MEVVDEPFGRRRDGALLADHLGEDAIALEQDTAVVSHSRREPLTRGRGTRPMEGNAPSVLLEPLNAQQILPDRLARRPERCERLR
jgi:hypothetical protein